MEFAEFLRSRNISEETIQQMEDEKINISIINLMSDPELKRFIPHYGDRVALKHFCQQSQRGETSNKEPLINRIKQKLGIQSATELPQKKARSCNSKDLRAVDLGWRMKIGDKDKQVRSPTGGGTRKVKLPKYYSKQNILRECKNLFFPNGKSVQGDEDLFHFELLDFQYKSFPEGKTIADVLKNDKVKHLRFFLLTEYRSNENDEVADENEGEGHQRQGLQEDSEDHRNIEADDLELPHTPSTLTYNDCTHDVFDTADLQLEDSDISINTAPLSDPNIPECPSDANELTILINSILDEQNLTETEENNVLSPGKSLQDIIRNIQSRIDQERINKFNVYRDDIFGCSLRAMRRKTFNPFFKISVKFSDSEGASEGAVDEGGPCREMFRLLLNFLSNSEIFIGQKKKYLSININCLNDKHYFEAGRIIALSLVHGGPGPHFFSETLFSVVAYGLENVVPTLQDVELDVRNVLVRFEEVEDISELQEIIIHPIFTVAGFHYIRKVEDKPKIISDVLQFYVFQRMGAVLEQFIEGLKTCDIYSYIKAYPVVFKQVLCEDKTSLTSTDMENFFENILYSESGSNRRLLENRTITFFRDYIIDCEENASSDSEAVESVGGVHITLSDILIFATGADCIPPLGFPVKPKMSFLHCLSKFPTANTCALELRIPVVHTRYEDFKYNMDFGIGNSPEFGFA